MNVTFTCRTVAGQLIQVGGKLVTTDLRVDAPAAVDQKDSLRLCWIQIGDFI